MVKAFRLTLAACAASVLLVASGQAQGTGSGLTLSLLERYLDALRLEFAVPGLSAAVVDDGRVWERGFGQADIAANLNATPTTPYPITGLTQTIGAAMVLQHCIDSGRATLNDQMLRWIPFPDPAATIGQVLAHVSPAGVFRYDPARYASLTDVTAECGDNEFDNLLADGILDRFAMVDSVPGRDVLSPARARLYTSAQLARYTAALRRLAVPYKLDSKRTPTRTDYSSVGVSASTGLISTAHDLAQFDAALMSGALISANALALSWNAPQGRPGLGWFVQTYNGQRVVWQFGLASDAYSSLIVKIPDRRLTFILLANSDSLTNAVNPQAPDVTQSLFARTFLRLFIS